MKRILLAGSSGIWAGMRLSKPCTHFAPKLWAVVQPETGNACATSRVHKTSAHWDTYTRYAKIDHSAAGRQAIGHGSGRAMAAQPVPLAAAAGRDERLGNVQRPGIYGEQTAPSDIHSAGRMYSEATFSAGSAQATCPILAQPRPELGGDCWRARAAPHAAWMGVVGAALASGQRGAARS